MKQQGGFTLIELIVVIVILGILAATALPRFSGLTADARAAQMQGIAASMRAAATMAHGQALAEQATSSAAITLENGANITMYWFYPSNVANGIGAAIDVPATASATQSGVFAYAISYDVNHPNCVVIYNGAQNPSNAPASVTATDVTGTANIQANCS